jgi:nucleoid-associated protein YgaU
MEVSTVVTPAPSVSATAANTKARSGLLYTVQPGDSLFLIAEKRLGYGNRWPEILALNRDIIEDPDLILPGQELILPPLTAPR